jgi:hypothetical protein
MLLPVSKAWAITAMGSWNGDSNAHSGQTTGNCIAGSFMVIPLLNVCLEAINAL